MLMYWRPPAQDSARWLYLQQIWQRVAVAAKFFLAAAWLGPQAIGLVSIAVVAVAISEAISETGIPQALIQAHDDASPRTGHSLDIDCGTRRLAGALTMGRRQRLRQRAG